MSPGVQRRLVTVLCLLILSPLVTGCVAPATAGGKPSVVAAFYPLAYLAQRIVGTHAQVTDLTEPGLEPHDLELTPEQVAEISQSDVTIYEHGFQPAVDAAVAQNPPRRALDVASVVPLRNTDAPSEPGLTGDPHIWQDPVLLIPVAKAFAADMAAVDPRHAAAYRSNARSYIAELKRLDAAYRHGLAHCQRRVFVTSHAAFGYLAQRYGLTMVSIAGLSPEAEPSAQHLAQIQNLIEKRGITTVFSEVLGTQKYADTLAHDLGIRAEVLDPIEGLPSQGSHQTYFTLMRANLSRLEEANGCS